MDDSNESQNVAQVVKSPPNFLRVSFGSFTLVMTRYRPGSGVDTARMPFSDSRDEDVSSVRAALGK